LGSHRIDHPSRDGRRLAAPVYRAANNPWVTRMLRRLRTRQSVAKWANWKSKGVVSELCRIQPWRSRGEIARDVRKWHIAAVDAVVGLYEYTP
jgi:hypothetical protein